jgi:hypothetical protein
MDAKTAARAELDRERAGGVWNDDEGYAVDHDSADRDSADRDSTDTRD